MFSSSEKKIYDLKQIIFTKDICSCEKIIVTSRAGVYTWSSCIHRRYRIELQEVHESLKLYAKCCVYVNIFFLSFKQIFTGLCDPQKGSEKLPNS